MSIVVINIEQKLNGINSKIFISALVKGKNSHWSL